MIELNKTSKIYIYCPGKIVTGGAELLHQLCHILNENNLDASMVYFDNAQNSPKEYAQYNIKIANEVADSKNNVLVLYEAIFDRYRNHPNCQLLLWWLSVDHFYIYSFTYLDIRDYFRWNFRMSIEVIIKRFGYLLLKQRNYFSKNISIKQLSALNAVNGYQSDYAKSFLKKNNFKQLMPLSDYINPDFYSNSEIDIEKENIILYNPKKGLAFTKKIIERLPGLKWVALQGMDRKTLKEVFQKSKLYIDFGYHPGKDRLPREAVLNDCCILTGILGSAGHFEDIPIGSEYKIDQKTMGVADIANKIEDILANYDTHIEHFSEYKKKTLNEQDLFEQEVLKLFKI